jgi:hypothetical protein
MGANKKAKYNIAGNLTKITLLAVLYLIISIVTAKSQSKFSGFEEIEKIKKTLKNYDSVTIFNSSLNEIHFDESDCFKCETGSYSTIWNGNELKFWKNGTGKVYAYNNGKVERVDQTCYQGSTFGAIVVEYKDTLFSIGGYGFWSINGGLRFLNKETKEWYIQPVNKRISVSSGVNAIWQFDSRKGLLYVIYNPYRDEYHTEDDENKNTLLLQALNLNTKKWWDSPKKIHPDIASNIKEIGITIPFYDGLLINSTKTPFIFLDFSTNKILKLKEKKSIEIVQKKDRLIPDLSFTSTNGFHIYNLALDTVISIKLSKKDFEKSNIPLIADERNTFKIDNPKISNPLIIALTVFCIFLVLYTVKLKINNDKLIHKATIQAETNNYYGFINSLLPVEANLLTSILKSSLEDKKTSVETINNLLGLDNKSLKIQNNQRAEVISNINKKFNIKINKIENIIERNRVEIDKRLFEYYINIQFKEELKKQLEAI